jgi:hypothetical protein
MVGQSWEDPVLSCESDLSRLQEAAWAVIEAYESRFWIAESDRLHGPIDEAIEALKKALP